MEDAEVEQSRFEAPRYHRILVAIDDSAAAAFALRHAVATALEQRSRLTLVTVVPRRSAAVANVGMAPQDLESQMEEEAAGRLRRLVAALPPDLSVTTVLRHGDPAEEIVRLLAEEAFDLLCMGARGRGWVANLLLGSVSAAMLRRSPVPVLIFHPSPD